MRKPSLFAVLRVSVIPVVIALVMLAGMFPVPSIMTETVVKAQSSQNNALGNYVFFTPNGNVNVNFSKPGPNFGRFTFTKQGQPTRTYTLRTAAPGYAELRVNGSFVLSVTGMAPDSPQISADGCTFSDTEAKANPNLYQSACLSLAKQWINNDLPIICLLFGYVADGVAFDGFVGLGTGNWARNNPDQLRIAGYELIQAPVTLGFTDWYNWTFGGCLTNCSLWYSECTQDRNWCVSGCEAQWGQRAVDYRRNCNLPASGPIT